MTQIIEWKIVPISSFLKERENRIKPAEANKMGLNRTREILEELKNGK